MEIEEASKCSSRRNWTRRPRPAVEEFAAHVGRLAAYVSGGDRKIEAVELRLQEEYEKVRDLLSLREQLQLALAWREAVMEAYMSEGHRLETWGSRETTAADERVKELKARYEAERERQEEQLKSIGVLEALLSRLNEGNRGGSVA